MMCKNPYVGSEGLPFGCGQCMPCRFNKRRIWMHRIMLEAALYEDNSFVTLTYSDDNLPVGGTLVPEHYQQWLKRLRLKVAPSRFRFFLVGEYGDETQRPHYHAALFGFPTCVSGDTRISCIKRPCHWCQLVRDTWGHGNIMLGRLEDDSAGYMAGYVTKKMTHKDDTRLNGRFPEFGRMSLKPGIGYDALWDIANTLFMYELDSTLDDVPFVLMHGQKTLPLGRYLRQRLRTLIGKEKNAPQAAMDKLSQELLPLRLAARASSENPSLKAAVVASTAGRVASMEARQKIYRKRKSL